MCRWFLSIAALIASSTACRLFNGAGLPASPFRIVNRQPN